MLRRVEITLVVAVIVPALGMAVNALWPAPAYGYFQEQGVLLALALAALLLVRFNATGAAFLYCALALFPVGAMLEYYQSIGGGWSVLELAPVLGILFVTALLRDERVTLLYGGIAIVASGVFCGQICNDWGQAGAMAFFSGGLTAVLYGWLGCNTQKIITLQQEIRGKQRIINNKQELANDP